MRHALLLILAGCLSLVGCSSSNHRADESPCGSLAGAQIGYGVVTETESKRTDDHLLGFFTRAFLKFMVPGLPEIKAPVDFCLATAKLNAVEGSEITLQIWLPVQWNGKLVGTGGGGTNGGLFGAPLTLQDPVKKGYVTFATDAGHKTSDSAKFAYDSQQQYIDWAYRANHLAAVFAKDLAASYYGKRPARSYFHGCSNGGRDALMLAQRYPDDYDAIISGAPAAAWTELGTSFMWYAHALHGNPGAPELGDKLDLIRSAILEQCDLLDGVNDGLLENPLQCDFNPASLACGAGQKDDTCLTEDEVVAMQKVYSGPMLKDGTSIYPGMPVGGEIPDHWQHWMLTTKKGGTQISEQVFRWMVHRDPKWSWEQFDIERDYELARQRMSSITDADNPDISKFVGAGGKLLMYHGWNDAAIPATATINYVEQVRDAIGSDADKSIRLFMAPGVGHCSGGEGPHDFDMLHELDQWVETGVAPERVTATQFDPPQMFAVHPDAKVVRTRPLCPWPKVARYSGQGSTDEADNFTCQ